MLLMPQTLGPLTLLQRRGEDSISKIYEGSWLGGTLGDRVLIRWLKSWVTDNPEILEPLLARVVDLSSLRHPGLLRVLDHVTQDGARFIVEEQTASTDLAALLEGLDKRGGTMPTDVVLHLATRITETVAALHAQSGRVTGVSHLLHLALRPDAVRITPEGSVRLGGFGAIGRYADVPTRHRRAPPARSTGYLAPEQVAQDTEFSVRTDLWSLGAVFTSLLTLQPLVSASSHLEASFAVRSFDPTPSLRMAAQRLPGFERVLAGCLARRPSDRFSGATEVLEALSRCDRHRKRHGAATGRLRDLVHALQLQPAPPAPPPPPDEEPTIVAPPPRPLAQSHGPAAWVLRQGTEEFAVRDLETLLRWVDEGRVTPRAEISEDLASWSPVTEHPGLAAAFLRASRATVEEGVEAGVGSEEEEEEPTPATPPRVSTLIDADLELELDDDDDDDVVEVTQPRMAEVTPTPTAPEPEPPAAAVAEVAPAAGTSFGPAPGSWTHRIRQFFSSERAEEPIELEISLEDEVIEPEPLDAVPNPAASAETEFNITRLTIVPEEVEPETDPAQLVLHMAAPAEPLDLTALHVAAAAYTMSVPAARFDITAESSDEHTVFHIRGSSPEHALALARMLADRPWRREAETADHLVEIAGPRLLAQLSSLLDRADGLPAPADPDREITISGGLPATQTFSPEVAGSGKVERAG